MQSKQEQERLLHPKEEVGGFSVDSQFELSTYKYQAPCSQEDEILKENQLQDQNPSKCLEHQEGALLLYRYQQVLNKS